MRELFILVAHLLATLAKLMRPGGVRSVVAESLLLKHQLLTLKRSRKRAPKLKPWDRLLLGFGAACVSPARVPKIAIALRASTFLRFHQALARLKYHLLYASQRRRQPGPKGPSRELIAAIVELKRRNPRFGCVHIAQQSSHTFGVNIDKDVVRRVLAKHYRPDSGTDGPSWLTFIGQAKDSLWCIDLFRCESILLRSHWVMVVMDLFTRRIIGFGIAPANIDGVSVCRMFNHAIADQPLPKRLSTDHDLLFRFHRWLANLRVLEIEEIKSIPYTPVSHPFVERLIGTIRREYLDRVLFWNSLDLKRKLEEFRIYYNSRRVHQSLGGSTPEEHAGKPAPSRAALDSYGWQQHCRGLFQTPVAA
jgi:putative transposase